MDKKIEKKKWTAKRVVILLLLLTVVPITAYQLFAKSTVSVLKVDREILRFSVVEHGDFQEFIPIEGNVIPIKTIYLDAILGGKVTEVFKDDGDFVNIGDTIATLHNPNMTLDYMNKETQMIDIINNLQNTKASLEQNQFNLKKELLDYEHQLQSFKKEFEVNAILIDKKAISKKEFDDSKRTFEYWRNKVNLTRASIVKDSIATNLQLAQLQQSIGRMERNLDQVKENLKNLMILAPMEGQLSSLNMDMGELKNSGDRLGQIDIVSDFKVSARVDERYIQRTPLGQLCILEDQNTRYEMAVAKIHPEVNGGMFEIDLVFKNEVPKHVKRGQNVRLKLLYGEQTSATLLKRGSYFHDTGGSWVFVFNEQENKAYKRNITLGKQNTEYFEV
ncbi:MAG: hypothetical protein MRY83_13640, partial [Flavobacteriales bacterium]|nr:hypothetical protein [Flavobacteriales bacterium]